MDKPANTEPTPDVLLKLAIEKDIDVIKLEKLLELQQRWKAANAKTAFAEAMANFQSLIPPLKKTKLVKYRTKNDGVMTYKFAPLGEIDEAVKEPMKVCGLFKRWEFEQVGDELRCTFIVTHRDGHSETTVMTAPKDDSGGKNSIQQKGSTMTYLQRYTMIAGLGISTADDDTDAQGEDDGAAGKNENKNKGPQTPQEQKPDGGKEKKPEQLPWLNEFIDRDSTKGNTKEWLKVIAGLTRDDNPKDIKDVYELYSVSKTTRTRLEEVVKQHKEAKANKHGKG